MRRWGGDPLFIRYLGIGHNAAFAPEAHEIMLKALELEHAQFAALIITHSEISMRFDIAGYASDEEVEATRASLQKLITNSPIDRVTLWGTGGDEIFEDLVQDPSIISR